MSVARTTPLSLLVLALALASPTLAAKAPDDGLPSVDEVATQARAVYDEMAGNSDPLVRRAVFEGRLALGGDDAVKAIEAGLEDADPVIREKALELALTSKDRKLKALGKKAEKALAKLLESADEADRALGYRLLDAHETKKKAWLGWVSTAARDGSPEARAAARGKLLAEGGKVAWDVIEKGLAEEPSEPEHAEALEALKTFDDPVAMKWALATMNDEGQLGRLARGVLIRIDDKRAAKKLERDLEKTYDKSAEFEERLRIAVVLAGRGQVDKVTRTLLAGLKYQKPWSKVLAFEGLAHSRDLTVLGKLREYILTNQNEEQADAAYDWLRQWAAAKGEPAVFEILQEAARGDRRPLRMRAMAALTELKHRPSVAVFEAAMKEGQTEVRLAAAKGIAAVAKPGDEARIADFLRREPDNAVKLVLIEALANIGTPEILDPLQFFVTARDTELKTAAAKAIAATQKPKAAQLLGLLRRDPDLDVRFLALHALLTLEPKDSLAMMPAAIQWLRPDQVEALGQDAKVPVEAIQLIAEKGDDAQRTFAVEALKTRGGDKAAIRLLTLFEKSPHADTSATALAALAAVRKAESVPTYRQALQHADGAVRAVAYAAVGAYGPRALLEATLQGLADKEPRARVEAARAAVQLAGRDA
ncbi:MAG: HEAT repeat domain-containing protein [Myxococcales bacterium]|nr:HEAT repeat domain-containing protein [Myxococcales bacterium]